MRRNNGIIHQYDKREAYNLSDGGLIYLDFMGNRFKNIESDQNPIIFAILGQESDNQTPYVVNLARDGPKYGFDICIINHRGCSGALLTTPYFYDAHSFMSYIEPINYVC